MSSFSIDKIDFIGSYIIGEHSQQSWELTYVSTPGGFRTINNIRERCEGHELILIPPGVSHGWEFPEDISLRAVSMYFTSETLKALKTAVSEMMSVVTSVLSVRSAIVYNRPDAEKIGKILAEAAIKDEVQRIPEILRLLIMISDTSGTVPVGGRIFKSATQRKMDMIASFCRSNYQKSISLREAASVFGLNVSAMCSFIKRHTGLTFTGYMNKCRLEMAEHLLAATDMSVSDIAYEVGFSNVSYMCRVFRKSHGVTPLAFRNRT